jgi:hypothetical protein
MSEERKTSVWTHQIDDVMLEISRQAALCKVKLLDPGVIEAVLHNNESVCGTANPRAFKKLREALMMGFVVREKAYDQLGPIEADELITGIREKLKERFGGKLGGATGTA